jgi:hypothetical protein
VLVVALEERVAAWARDPVSLGPGGSVFRAIVIGPSVTDAHPSPPTGAPSEVSILWALWCGKRDRSAVASALGSIARFDKASVAAYLDLLRYLLTDEVVEAVMATSENKYLSDYARKIYSESEAKGKAEGVRSVLLTVLSARALVPDAAERARIDSCSDVAILDLWLRRAATAEKVEAVFDG